MGTDATGTKPLGNAQTGVFVEGYNNRIGAKGQDADPAAEGNLISGNPLGVGLQGGGQNVVAGNLIGTDVTGTKSLGNSSAGVDIYVSNDNLIGTNGDGVGDSYERNVISGNGDDGVVITYSNNNVLAGNYIGMDVTGTRGLGQDAGVFIFAGVDNTIGGTATGDGNLIAGGNSVGIGFNGGSTDTGNVVQGNSIGTNAAGNPYIGNHYGIELSGVGNIIGGTTPGAGNTISDNGGYGVWITSSGSGDLSRTDNLVQGNRIEFNGLPGVEIDSGSQSNTIGGTTAGAGNTIDNNRLAGVVVIGSTTVGNAIRGNAILAENLGIDLGGNGVTIPNTPGGPHTGPNDLQNYPILTSATPDATEVQGTFNSTPSTTFALDFYGNGAYYGDESYLGSAAVTTDSSGNATFDVTGLAATSPGETIVATATDPNGNTSEFSPAVYATAATTTTLTSPSGSSVYGQTQVTVSAAPVDPAYDVSPYAPLGGTVQLIVDGADFGSPIAWNGESTLTIDLPVPVGAHTVSETFTPQNFVFDPSSSGEITLTVTPAPLTITADNLTKLYGTTLTFAGTEFTTTPVSYYGGVSSVTLTSDGAAATATLTGSPYSIVPSNAVGVDLSNYTITYVDGTLTVVGDPTSTTMTASSVALVSGQQVTFTATVSSSGPASGPPTGTISFYDGTTQLGAASLVTASGVTTATLTTAALAVGLQSVTAVYGGDADFAGSNSQVITTFAGDGNAGYSGDGGPATAAELNLEVGSFQLVSGAGGGAVAVDAQGDLFIADTGNDVIREVTPGTDGLYSDGTITTVAGGGSDGDPNFSGLPTDVALSIPSGLTINAQGDLVIADTGGNVIREVTPEPDGLYSDGTITTVAGNGTADYGGDGGPATAAALNQPYAVAVDGHGDLFIADTGNNVIREVQARRHHHHRRRQRHRRLQRRRRTGD